MEERKQNVNNYSLDDIYDRTDIRVVGWSDYDSDEYESEPLTDEVFFAVAREVHDKEYLFGGDAHQDRSDCAPVLNTGRMARFSTRDWGTVIAIAYDEKLPDGRYNYSLGYMDELINAAYKKYPNTVKRPPVEHIPSDCPSFDLVMPAPYTYDTPLNVFVCPATAETEKYEDIDTAHIIDTLKKNKGKGYYRTVDEIYRDDTFEYLIEEIETDEPILQINMRGNFGAKYGFPDIDSAEELIKKLKELYSEENGVIGIIFETD